MPKPFLIRKNEREFPVVKNHYNRMTDTVTESSKDKTLLEVLLQDMSLSTRMIRQLKGTDNLLVNGHRVSVNARMRAGDVITVVFEEAAHQIYPNDLPIEVVYEDDDLVIINKQAGMVAHPTMGHPSHTLSNALRHYALGKGEDYKPRLVNRLDRDTTGIMIFAKNAYAQHVVSEEMKANRVQKYYLALVHGRVQKSEGVVDAPIEREAEDSMRRIVREDGKQSVTHYQIVRELNNATLLKIDLKTGRTHQIRVHMSYLGHPLVGDELYGSFERAIIKRQALHAYEMTFKSPRRGMITVTAPLPDDLSYAVAFLA